MKKLSFSLLTSVMLLCLMVAAPHASRANRAAGGELTWNWVSDSTYKLIYKFYKDCSGATAEPTTVNVCYYNNCNAFTGSVALTKSSAAGNGSVVVNACSSPNNTICTSPSSTIKGYREWVYEGFVTLPSRCKYWHFVASIAERNSTSISNLSFGAGPSDRNLFVEATLDNLNAPGCSAPDFPKPGIAYVCNGVVQIQEYGGVDPDGDVLTYTLVNPTTAPDNQTSCVFPPSPASIGLAGTINLTNNPLFTGNTFSLNGTDGTMAFTPTTAQVSVLTVLVQKWRGGNVIGSVMRDIQFNVINCTTPMSTIAMGPVTGGLANADSIRACPDAQVSFCFNIISPDPTVKITLDDNHLTFSAPPTVPNGSSGTSNMNYTNQNTANVQGCFDWTPTVPDSNSHILVIKATYCKPGNPAITQTFPIKINISPKTWGLKDTMICFGESIKMYAYGGTNFAWTVASGSGAGTSIGITGSSSPIAEVTPTETTYYQVESDYPTFCRLNVDTVKITVLNPKIDIGPDTTICSYNQLQLSANLLNPEAGVTYTWLWTPGTYLTDSTIPNPIAKYPKDYITYRLKVIPGGVARCAKEDTVLVKVLKGFTLNNKDTAICNGSSVKVEGWGDTGYTYTWVPNSSVSNPAIYNPILTPTAPTTYTLLASYPGCSDSIRKIFVDVQPLPVVNAGPDRSICFGDTIHMKGSVNPDPATYTKYTYSWTPGGAISRADTLDAVFTGYLSTEITLTVKTPAGCTGSDKVNYIVQPRDFLTVSKDISICPGTIGNIWADGGNLLHSLTWKPQTRIDSVHSKTPKVWPVFTTDYVVVAKDSNNCIDSATVRVNVLPNAVIYLPDSVVLYPGQSYEMNPQGNALYYTWFPGVGMTNPNIANPIVSPITNTRYYVTGRTEAGCSVTDSIDVFIAPDTYLDIPNAFVPGHGPNNVFKVVRLGDATLQSFTIYNRWGSKMFETKDIDEGWDGTFGGQPQPMGVYVYVVEATTANGQKFVKQGNVTLIR